MQLFHKQIKMRFVFDNELLYIQNMRIHGEIFICINVCFYFYNMKFI